MTSHNHRAEVIEIAANGMGAAVRFTSGRVEWVNHNGTGGHPDYAQIPFAIGQRGMASFVRSIQGYHWTFTPSKAETKAYRSAHRAAATRNLTAEIVRDCPLPPLGSLAGVEWATK